MEEEIHSKFDSIIDEIDSLLAMAQAIDEDYDPHREMELLQKLAKETTKVRATFLYLSRDLDEETCKNVYESTLI